MTTRLLRLLGRTATVLAIAVAALTVAGLAVVSLRGDQVMIVMSGSMQPEFAAGDAVLISPAQENELEPGQVVSYHAPGQPEQLTTHRILTRRPMPQGLFLQTKGDANATPDPDFVAAGAVVGILEGSVPHLGRWLAFYQTPPGRMLVLGLPLGMLCIAQARSMWRDHRRRRTATSDATSSPVLASVAVVLAVSVVAGAVMARSTSARFTGADATSGNALSTATTYCGTGTTYQQAVIADSPLIYHRFSEATGTTAANLGTATTTYNGTYTGGYTLARPGAIACESGTAANAVRLNGSNAHVTSNGAASTSPATFSLEIWFRTTTGGGKLIGLGNSRTGSSTAFGRHLYLTNGGQLVFGVRDGTTGNPVREVTSPATYLDGRWHHAVATFSANSMRLYVDGAQVASRTDVASAQSYNGWLRIGYDNLAGVGSPPSNPWFTGDLDEAAAYGSALTAARVSAHYTERRN